MSIFMSMNSSDVIFIPYLFIPFTLIASNILFLKHINITTNGIEANIEAAIWISGCNTLSIGSIDISNIHKVNTLKSEPINISLGNKNEFHTLIDNNITTHIISFLIVLVVNKKYLYVETFSVVATTFKFLSILLNPDNNITNPKYEYAKGIVNPNTYPPKPVVKPKEDINLYCSVINEEDGMNITNENKNINIFL